MLNKNCKKPAYSLVYSLVIVTIVMIVASTAIQGTLGKLTYYNDVLSGVYAKYSAESAIDTALLAIKDAEAGYEIAETSTSTGSATSAYTVVARAQHNTNNSTYYYTPIPMTGTASPSDECDYLSSTDDAVNDACNWNKILYGQSVTIPLYSYDSSTGLIKTPSDLGLSSWSLKVRTPCTDGTYADGCTRYSLDGSSSSYANDASIVLWQLVGVSIAADETETTVATVVPVDDTSQDSRTHVDTRTTSTNTEIYESLVNTASTSTSAKYSVLTSSSPTSTTIGTTSYTTLLGVCNDTTIDKLYLQLSVVNQLETSSESVPYLEWQLESTMTGGAFADNKAVVVGEGYYVGQSGTFYYPSVVTRTTVGERASIYTISN